MAGSMATSKAASHFIGLSCSSLPRFRAPSPKSQVSVCQQCRRRAISSSPTVQAGHNKWSKTKHIKAVTDKKKMAERTFASKLISLCSRLYGPDPTFNPQLANAISAATKASVPRTVIENAIARGQGRSATGAQLESLTLEFIFPPDVAIVLEVETDNKNRSLQDLRAAVRKGGGIVGTTAFYFTRRGRAVFSSSARDGKTRPSLSELLDEAIEHEGTEDVEELPGGDYVVWTEPSMLTAVTEALAKKLELDVLESDIVWAPNEDTKVSIDSKVLAETLSTTFANLREHTEVKGLYANIRQGAVADEEWEKIDSSLDM